MPGCHRGSGNPVLQRDTASFSSDSRVLAAGVSTGTRVSEMSEMLVLSLGGQVSPSSRSPPGPCQADVLLRLLPPRWPVPLCGPVSSGEQGKVKLPLSRDHLLPRTTCHSVFSNSLVASVLRLRLDWEPFWVNVQVGVILLVFFF